MFGLHLLTLDIRQHSARHEQAVDEVLKAAGVCPNYLELTPDEFRKLFDTISLQTPSAL